MFHILCYVYLPVILLQVCFRLFTTSISLLFVCLSDTFYYIHLLLFQLSVCHKCFNYIHLSLEFLSLSQWYLNYIYFILILTIYLK